MSVKLMGRVWELDLPHSQQSVSLALADHGKDDGTSIFPSVGHVAWKVGYSERQVQRIMRQLEDSGLLIRVAEATGHRPTEYRMNTGAVPAKPPWEPKRGDKRSGRQDDTPGADGTPGVTTGHPRGDTATSPEPSKEPPVNRSAPNGASPDEPVHPEATRLSCLLASLIRQHEAKAKVQPRGARWVKDMRLLLNDRDGNAAEVEFVIRWCQADEFESSNVLSPGKLRRRFTQLLLKAQRQAHRGEHLQAAEPLAGYSAEARARLDRTARRMGVSVHDLINNKTDPTGGSNGIGSNAGGVEGAAPSQPLLPSSAST